MHQIKQICGILLAAGHSRRFGAENKLLQTLPNGQTIALTAANNLLAALPVSIAITRTAAVMATLSASNIEVISCPQHAEEMADSLAAAIAHATAKHQPQAYVIALADMSFIKPETITRIAEKLSAGAEIVIPTYQDKRGHPVGFSAKFTEKLLALKGDEGARTIIQQHAHSVVFLACDDAGILKDIDTPKDLRN